MAATTQGIGSRGTGDGIDEFEEFFQSSSPPRDLAAVCEGAGQFVAAHQAAGRSIVLVTVSSLAWGTLCSGRM